MSSKDVLLLPHESKKKPNEIHTEVIDPPLPGSIERVCIYHEGMICSRENASVEERADHVLYYYSSCSRGHRHLPSQHTNGRNGALENGLISQIYPKMHHFSWNPSHLNEHNYVQGSHNHVQGSHIMFTAVTIIVHQIKSWAVEAMIRRRLRGPKKQCNFQDFAKHYPALSRFFMPQEEASQITLQPNVNLKNESHHVPIYEKCIFQVRQSSIIL